MKRRRKFEIEVMGTYMCGEYYDNKDFAGKFFITNEYIDQIYHYTCLCMLDNTCDRLINLGTVFIRMNMSYDAFKESVNYMIAKMTERKPYEVKRVVDNLLSVQNLLTK